MDGASPTLSGKRCQSDLQTIFLFKPFDLERYIWQEIKKNTFTGSEIIW